MAPSVGGFGFSVGALGEDLTLRVPGIRLGAGFDDFGDRANIPLQLFWLQLRQLEFKIHWILLDAQVSRASSANEREGWTQPRFELSIGFTFSV